MLCTADNKPPVECLTADSSPKVLCRCVRGLVEKCGKSLSQSFV